MSAAASPNSGRRVAVVTGGGRGLGRGVALALAEAGCDLVLGWRQDEKAATETIAAVTELGARAFAVHGDLTDPATSALLAKTALSELGELDVWVNNAGVSVLAPLLETTGAQMSHMMAVNYLGTFYGLQAAASAMRGAGRPGRVINVASDLGLRGAPLLAGYSATKFAVVGLTQAAAVELAPHSITVNAVCPGTAETDMVLAEQAAEAHWQGRSIDEVRQRLMSAVPAGKLCTPEDVGALVAWLSSPGAAYVTGQAICTNGGSILH
ncbi:MAG TPA: SDR family NAD(P)-dependent oxidoreductase [Acidimicrobiales bacterium]|nr:SDR family NAD(P)-dependent oxidoreductase [Acidimicrobiales bacterium]